MADVQRKVRVLVAASKRIKKEYFAYESELLGYQNKILLLEQQNQDYKILKMVWSPHLSKQELIDETKSMFPNVCARLQDTVV